MKFVAALAIAVLSFAAHAQPWETATPESQGMDPGALARLVEYGGNVKMDSLVVARHGRIVTEAYYAPFRADMLHRINSSTKAVVGALAGIAIARGELPPAETPVLDLFPQAAPADPRWRAMQLRHLLDQVSGMDWDEPLSDAPPRTMIEMERSGDWERFLFGRGMAQPPGERFNYNSGNSHLLALALERRTGTDLATYATRHLFEPLGITRMRWRKDPQGHAIGGYGIYLQTRDMARLGQLYLQKGEWNGQQVVPRAWAERVFAPAVEMGFAGFRYADGWWAIPRRNAFMMVGFHRQLVVVLPNLGIVAAVTGRQHYPFEDLVGHLERAAVGAGPLPPDARGTALLRERIAAVASDASPADTAKVTPAVASRTLWQVEDNRAGIREIALDLGATPPVFRVKMRTREMAGQLGLDGRFAPGEDGATPVFTRGRWVDPTTLELEQRWPEEAGAMSYTLKFAGDALEFTHVNQFGVKGTARGRAMQQQP